jgi:hypothetical protein
LRVLANEICTLKSETPPESPERRNFVGSGNDAFTCDFCGREVAPLAGGGFRNHCPHCLWSRHVDRVPGDRAAACGGLMEPVALEGSAASGWTILHRCRRCGYEGRNRAALDDPEQPDSWDRLLDLSAGR